MVDITTDFLLINGSLAVHEVRPLLAEDGLTIVVRIGGTFWVCTADEIESIIEGVNPNSELADTLFEYRPAMVSATSQDIPTDYRAVITDGLTVSGVSLSGELEQDLAAAAPSPAAESPTPVAESVPPVAESAPPATGWAEKNSNLGASRGIDEGTGEEDVEEQWNLETRFPRKVSIGSTTSLTVALTREAATGPDVSILPATLVAGTMVSVLIQARRGFEVVGASEGLVEANDDSLPIRFRLRAIDEGKGEIRVLFFVDATALGVITLEPVVLAEDETGADETPVPSSAVMPALDAGAAAPDLELVVLEDTSDGRLAYSLRVTSAALNCHLREFGPIVLHTDARSYFADLFAEIEGLDLGTAEGRETAQTRLEAKGDSLFRDLIPDELQRELWRARDQITRIRIDSEEPHIPWELIRLSGPDENGRIVAGRFLCEYEMTRWILGPGLHDELGMTSVGVVVPPDSGLTSAQEEKTFLNNLAGPERSVVEVPATFGDLMAAFADGRHDVWHFSGHGVAKSDQDPNRFAIQLSHGDKLTPNEISGPAANVGQTAPLVFLNACQVGQAGMSLTGLGGWAQQFLDVGAAGFVGAMWNVHDNPARDFAQTFYTRLLAGDTIGAATLQAREEIRRYQDATWLAYTVYGHPSAAVAPTQE